MRSSEDVDWWPSGVLGLLAAQASRGDGADMRMGAQRGRTVSNSMTPGDGFALAAGWQGAGSRPQGAGGEGKRLGLALACVFITNL